MMPKTGKLEWGRYSEYLSLKLLFDFDELTKREEKHVMKVLERNAAELFTAAMAAFLTPLVGLLQYKSVALFIIVTRVLTLSNTPTYHKQAHTVNMKILSSAVGCFVASSFQSWTNISAWSVGYWLLRGAVMSLAYSRATVTIPEYFRRLKDRLSDKTVEEIKEERKGTELCFNRLNLYCLGPLLSLLALLTFDLILSFLVVYNIDLVFQLKTVGIMSVLLFLNGQFIIAKSNYYDRDHNTQVLEMYAETLLSVYYLPKSAFFSCLGSDQAQSESSANLY